MPPHGASASIPDLPATHPATQSGALTKTRPSHNSALPALLIFLVALAFLLFNISNPQCRLFDEAYYIDGALSILHGHPDTNAEHPPLGKCLIAAGIKLAGDNPLGWRLMSAIFGALLLSIVYLWLVPLGRQVAWMAVALIASNGFWFVMSRVAMLPIFELTFTVLALYQLTERRFWLSGFALGLAIACRWNASFALLFVLAEAAFSDRVKTGVTAGVKAGVKAEVIVNAKAAAKVLAASALAYVLAWIPVVHLDPARFLRGQRYILDFHQHAAGNPTIQDHWYHWIVRTNPENALDHMVANPVVTALGILSVVSLLCSGLFGGLGRDLRRNQLRIGDSANRDMRYSRIAAIAGALFLLQWAITPRPFMYYYYYFDALTVMSIAAAIFFGRSRLTIARQTVGLSVPLTLIAAAWFVAHYAAFTALQSPYDTLFQF
jgi:dolichyl-phosphate-mannose--protein O-mannosyl transferase